MKDCIYCGAPLDDDSLYCANCGKKIESIVKMCPNCGSVLLDNSIFCTKCGTKLDKQECGHRASFQIDTASNSPQEEEEVIYDWEEKKDRKWWYIIGGILAIVLLAFGWYGYKHYLVKPNIENLELSFDEDSLFVERVNNWNELHNNKGFDNNVNIPYAESVFYYGSEMSGLKAAQEKQKALMRVANFTQECTNIKVTKLTDKIFVCDFEKHTYSNGKSKVHPNCYLFFSKEDGDIWKIKEESDLETDKKLLDKRTDSYDEVILPITLQYIRDYCNHLKLPYNYWSDVENTIKKEKLNVYHYYEGLWCEPYEIRGNIVMIHKYGKENPILKKLSQDNYNSFCDAIGRIKDVWNVVPFKVENGENNEPPLIQFKYEGKGFEDIIINAKYIEDGREEMDDIPVYHYNYVDNSGNRVNLEFISN